MEEKELKNEFEELCKKRFDKCIEKLRRKFRPYKKRPFLDRPVVLGFEYEEGKRHSGFYKNTFKKTQGFNRKWQHEIYIANCVYERYKKYLGWYGKYWGEKWIYWHIDEVLMHELIHAFVFEEFDWWEFEGISNINADYSPIFLSCLAFNNQYGNPYSKEFYKSELFEKVKNIKKYDTLFTILVHMLHEIEKELRDINNNNPNNRVEISFSSQHNTIRLDSTFKAIARSKDRVETSIDYYFSCGFMYDLSKLKKEYKKRTPTREYLSKVYIVGDKCYSHGNCYKIKKVA